MTRQEHTTNRQRALGTGIEIKAPEENSASTSMVRAPVTDSLLDIRPYGSRIIEAKDLLTVARRSDALRQSREERQHRRPETTDPGKRTRQVRSAPRSRKEVIPMRQTQRGSGSIHLRTNGVIHLHPHGRRRSRGQCQVASDFQSGLRAEASQAGGRLRGVMLHPRLRRSHDLR